MRVRRPLAPACVETPPLPLPLLLKCEITMSSAMTALGDAAGSGVLECDPPRVGELMEPACATAGGEYTGCNAVWKCNRLAAPAEADAAAALGLRQGR